MSDAAYAAVPHVVRLAEVLPDSRHGLLILAGWCRACAQLEGAAPIRAQLAEAWQEAAARALELTAQSLAQAQAEEERLRSLLSALAALQGHFALAFVLEGPDVGIDCPGCGAWIEATTSSLNPLRDSISP